MLSVSSGFQALSQPTFEFVTSPRYEVSPSRLALEKKEQHAERTIPCRRRWNRHGPTAQRETSHRPPSARQGKKHIRLRPLGSNTHIIQGDPPVLFFSKIPGGERNEPRHNRKNLR